MTVRAGLLDPKLDIQGAENSVSNRNLADEQNLRGAQDGATATGNGGTDNITAPVAGEQTATVAGAAFTASMIGEFVTIAAATNGVNIGTFLVTDVLSATQISYVNASGVVEANTSATFDVFEAYSLEDDISFIRTDRKAIKGTANHYDAVPTYSRPTAVGTPVAANLTNMAGKTVDAVSLVCTRKFENQAVAEGDTLVTMLDPGNLPHADAVDRTGIPIQDGADAANLASCYVDVIDPATGQGLTVLGYAVGQLDCDSAATAVTPADTETVVINDGVNPAVTFEFDTNASVIETATLRQVDISTAANEDDVKNALIAAINGAPTLNIVAENGGAGLVNLRNTIPGIAGNVAITETVTSANFVATGMAGGTASAGDRIFGITRAGSSTEPNGVEVHFFHVLTGDPISVVNAFTWERDLPPVLDLYYGYRDRLDTINENGFRTTLVNGTIGDAGQAQDIAEIRQAVGTIDGDTDLSSWLTNLTDFFAFSGLDTTPTVIESLNILNAQIGDRNYTGTVLTDGETLTASLQALANALSTSSVTRVIERLTAAVPKNTAHTLPGANSYTPDVSNNGQNLWVFWRKLLRDPGPKTTHSNDYAETSGTQITPYRRIRPGDSINYMIYQ